MIYTIITWGSSGIWLEIVKNIISRENHWAIIIDKKSPKVSTDFLISKKIIFLKFNLLRSNHLLNFLLHSQLNDLHIKYLVNNAWYQENIDILSIWINEFKRMYKVIIDSSLLLSQRYIKNFIKNKYKSWSIINITSIHSHIIREIPHYSSAKAALEMLSKELAYRVCEYDITVNCIAPWSIITPLLRKDLSTKDLLESAAKNVPMKRHGTVLEIANLVEYLQSDKARYITWTSIVVDWWLSLVI